MKGIPTISTVNMIVMIWPVGSPSLITEIKLTTNDTMIATTIQIKSGMNPDRMRTIEKIEKSQARRYGAKRSDRLGDSFRIARNPMSPAPYEKGSATNRKKATLRKTFKIAPLIKPESSVIDCSPERSIPLVGSAKRSANAA